MRWRRGPILLAITGVAVVAVAGSFWILQPAYRSYRQWAESRLKLIDDFNDGKDPNLIGGESFTQTASGSQISHAFLRVQTPSPGELACALTYHLGKQARVSWGTGLNDLDISAAHTVRFWLKADHLPLPELQVELVDGSGERRQSPISHLRATTSWQRVAIPLRKFPGVNTNRLSRFLLHISATDQPQQGLLYLDDLQFVGPASVFFRSLKDNLYDFPSRALVSPRRLLRLPANQMLRAIAGDTWGYFRDVVDSRHQLPLNYIQTRPTPMIGDYASTTDISMYLMSVVSAHDLDLIDYASAVARVRGTLEQLEKLQKWHGFFYNYYSTTNLQVTNQYISSVDNGWLAIALMVIRQAFPEIKPLASRMLAPMDFKVFYDPQNGQMRLGYEVTEGRFAPYHYGLLATEARIISVVAIGKGDVGEDHWFRIYRTLPKEWTWQRQSPQGEYNQYRGHDVFNGYYVYPHGQQEIPFVRVGAAVCLNSSCPRWSLMSGDSPHTD